MPSENVRTAQSQRSTQRKGRQPIFKQFNLDKTPRTASGNRPA
ncbi:TPA: hypothetical protein ACFRG8_002036 [Neisseria lactamica]